MALPFLAAGVAGGVVFAWTAGRLGSGLATLALVAAPFILWVVVTALVQAGHGLKDLRGSLRWWHALWFLSLASALVFRVRGVQGISENPMDAWAVYRVVVESVVALILLTRLALRRTEWTAYLLHGLVGWLLAYGLICLASSVWSVFPSWTLYKSVEYLVDIALIAAVVATVQSAEGYKSLLDWTWLLYGLLLVTVWVGAAVWPEKGLYARNFPVGVLGFRLQGVLPAVSANDVGTYSGILAVIALARIFPVIGRSSSRAWYGLLFLASVMTVVSSQTRSAIAGLVFAVVIMLIFSKRFGTSAFVGGLVTLMLAASSVGGIIWAFLERGQSTSQMESLSSRVDWWSFAWERFLERPFTGFGAYAGGRFAVLARMGFGETSTMHSDYLEIIVGTGFWGLLPILIALIGAWWYLSRFLRRSSGDAALRQTAYEAIAVLALLTLRSFFNTILSWHPPLHFMAILGLAEYLRLKLKEAPQEVPVVAPPTGDPLPVMPGIGRGQLT